MVVYRAASGKGEWGKLEVPGKDNRQNDSPGGKRKNSILRHRHGHSKKKVAVAWPHPEGKA